MRFFTKKRIISFSIFLFFLIIVFSVYQKLFLSYFESDEWAHLTYYFPLTQRPDGFWQAIWGTMYHTTALSQGMHVIPIAWGVFYLDTLFFGMNYPPYAFITLFLHAVNSFLVFYLLRLLLTKEDAKKRSVIQPYLSPLVAGIFFALSPTPIHAITGAAPFYGQNVLSVSFFLFCLISFRKAFLTTRKKYLLLSVIFLFLAVLSKETTAFLFLLLPAIALIEKRIFSLRFLAKWYIAIVLLFLIIRFALPQVALVFDPQPQQTVVMQTGDSTAITNTDLSIHENLPGEIFFRATTYPIRMLSQVFFSRPTISTLVEEVVLFVYPKLGNEESLRSQNRLAFSTGPANDFLIYFFSISLIALISFSIKFAQRQKEQELIRSIVIGIAIIVLSTLPLVAIIFSFPRWGYDTYFDSRHYYAPTVGGALLFPFLLLSLGHFLSQCFRLIIRIPIPSAMIAFILFALWLNQSLSVIAITMKSVVDETGAKRLEIVTQIQHELPRLPQKVVFLIETDGQGPYGLRLPFQTSIAQMLSVIYYERSPLPEIFYSKPIFDGIGRGYLESEGRGFGYYDSKVALAEALAGHKFTVDNVYSYYHHSQSNVIEDETKTVRSEMKQYLEEAKEYSEWRNYSDASSSAKLAFRYPSDLLITESVGATTDLPLIKTMILSTSGSRTTFQILSIPPTFDLAQFILVEKIVIAKEVEEKEVTFDMYHKNAVSLLSQGEMKQYYLRFPTLLLVATVEAATPEEIETLEKILGSMKELN